MSEQKESRLLALVEELADAAKRVGLEVRREKILREIGYRARGGACRVRDRNLVIIDREQPAHEQLEVLAEALRARDFDSLYLSPAARQVIEAEPASS